jgi:uncharacterized protein YxeA
MRKMEEEKKSNKRLYVVIAFLCLLVLGLVGYIIYDKSLNNTQKVVNINKKDSKVDKEQNDSKENENQKIEYNSYEIGDKVTVKLGLEPARYC